LIGGNNVSHETIEILKEYAQELLRWNGRINLVGKSTEPRVLDRHIVDSIQVSNAVAAENGLWCDLGSGGGLPAVVIAILRRETDLQILCLESDRRKAAFLRHVAVKLDLKLDVISERIENVPPVAATILSARALAPLPVLLSFAERHGASGSTCVFPKGVRYEEEIAQARSEWRFSLETIPSTTAQGSFLLKIRDIERV